MRVKELFTRLRILVAWIVEHDMLVIHFLEVFKSSLTVCCLLYEEADQNSYRFLCLASKRKIIMIRRRFVEFIFGRSTCWLRCRHSSLRVPGWLAGREKQKGFKTKYNWTRGQKPCSTKSSCSWMATYALRKIFLRGQPPTTSTQISSAMSSLHY
jgi:hypothetical protein